MAIQTKLQIRLIRQTTLFHSLSPVRAALALTSTEGVERSPQLLVTSTEAVERSPQLVVTSPSSPSTEGIERSPQLVVTSQSCPSTQDVERSPQFVVTTPSGPSTEGVERLPQLLITSPSSPSTEGEVIAATIPTTNCNEHQGESSIEQNDRKIQSSWFTTYTWLQLEGGMFFCKSCTKANMTNKFTKGKSANLPKKDD